MFSLTLVLKNGKKFVIFHAFYNVLVLKKKGIQKEKKFQLILIFIYIILTINNVK